jgi:hypothetical protein
MTLYEKYLRRAREAFACRAAAESLYAMNRALDARHISRVPQDQQRVFRMLVEAGQGERRTLHPREVP